MDDNGVVLVTGYDDCAQILGSPDWGVIDAPWSDARLPGWREHRSRVAFMGSVLGLNGADHQRHRKCMIPALSRRAVERRSPALRQITRRELERFRAGLPHADLALDLADRLPVLATCHVLGLEPADPGVLQRWAADIAACHEIAPSPSALRAADAAIAELRDYLRRTTAAPDGLVAELRDQQDRHLDEVVFLISMILLTAGWETTSFLLANLVHLLYRHPDQDAALRTDLSLAPRAVDEALRLESPTLLDTRVAQRDTVVGGRAVRRGQLAYVFHAAANRDPAAFTDPHRFDVRRPEAHHLAFGHGAHLCVGSHLARWEGRIFLETLLETFPRRLRVVDVHYRPGLAFRGFSAFKVA
ncbi:cytochrome P450 [Spirillospora sp. CA-253888]